MEQPIERLSEQPNEVDALRHMFNEIMEKLIKIEENQSRLDEKLIHNFKLLDSYITNTKNIFMYNSLLEKSAKMGSCSSRIYEAPISGSAVKASGEVTPAAKSSASEININTNVTVVANPEPESKLDPTPEPTPTQESESESESESNKTVEDPVEAKYRNYFIDNLISDRPVLNKGKVTIKRIIVALKMNVKEPITRESANDIYNILMDNANNGATQFKNVASKIMDACNNGD